MDKVGDIIIQRRIEEVMNSEFNKMIEEYSDNELLKLIVNGQIDDLSLDELKDIIGGDIID